MAELYRLSINDTSFRMSTEGLTLLELAIRAKFEHEENPSAKLEVHDIRDFKCDVTLADANEHMMHFIMLNGMNAFLEIYTKKAKEFYSDNYWWAKKMVG